MPVAPTVPPTTTGRKPWLVLLHQVPPKPDYLRVKVRRRLERIGAAPLRNAVYVLPATEQALEDFQWLAREIVADGGEATVCEAAFVEGVRDEELVATFRTARDADYAAVAEGARALAVREPAVAWGAALGRLKRQLAEASAIDFFDAPGRAAAERTVAAAEARLRAAATSEVDRMGTGVAPPLHGRVWVTRRDVHVDRIASAWLIRRFIDPAAQFRFVDPTGYEPAPGELRFDMYDAEYTHEGAHCTFETLVARFGLAEPALQVIGEIVHDIDFKDAAFAREETAGVAALVAGIVRGHATDEARLDRGGALFEDLYAAFQARPHT